MAATMSASEQQNSFEKPETMITDEVSTALPVGDDVDKPTPLPLGDDEGAAGDAKGRSPSPSSDSEEWKVEKKETKSGDGKAAQKGGKSKKKEDKSIEHVLKALSSLETTEEKLAALCKKYTDLYDENRSMNNSIKQNQRKLTVVMREKDQLQSEHSKSILAKSKLESLCRELQRHNKLIKDESLARAREEEEKRKEVSAKFQSTINDIQTQMNDNQSRNGKLKEENLELATKLKGLIEQYEMREQHIDKVFKHKELETQLAEAKLAQCNLQLAELQEKTLKEKQLLLTDMTEAKKKMDLMEQNEKQLKAQLALYSEKYEDFQSTLTKSNEVFGSFKSEMDKMTKKLKKLEKETAMWRQRWENSNKALLEMAEEKSKSDKDLTGLQAKVSKLEKLCRALQAERRGGPKVTVTEESSNYSLDTTENDVQPTKTPPNTPSTPQSRASPTNVEGAPSGNNLVVNGHVGDNGDNGQSKPTLQQDNLPSNHPQENVQAETNETLPVENGESSETDTANGQSEEVPQTDSLEDSSAGDTAEN